MRVARLGLFAVVALGALGACGVSSDAGVCRTDRDCGDDVCTRVGQCEASDAVYALRVEWTVRGLTTDQPAACADISELELAVEAPSTGDVHRVAPVPCAPGSFFFDRLPPSYTEVTVTAYGRFGEYLDAASGSAIDSGGVVRIALLP